MKVFVDVDTLNDFFEGGALPVPNAEEIREVLGKLTKLSKEQKIPVLKFCDSHDGSEPEMISNGGPFPYHCMKETEGSATIRETAHKRAIVFEKQTYDAFTNPAVEKWLTKNKVTEAWVYGVVGNICVESAVKGLRNLGIKTYVFENAVTWMDMEDGVFCNGVDNKEQSVKRIRKMGAVLAQSKI